ncbi:MAG: ABC transporter permease [Pirellulales bacterium]
MSQTVAIFHEAYRNLNSKKLFWFVLILSGFAVAVFACLGINESGIKVLVWQIDSPINTKSMTPDEFYKTMFVAVGIGFWLSWLATILALISTAGIFPDLITSGSIDLFVSKPISRLRLFLTEYLAGLLFVALQVAVFSLASFLVIGLRGGTWEPGLFLAVPLVACLFSYLFAVCVLVGVVTRSTVAALLLTLLFWFVVWGIGSAEQVLLMQLSMRRHGVDFASMAVELDAKGQPVKRPKAKPEPSAEDGPDAMEIAHRVAYDIKTVLPKTTETVALLERSLMRTVDLPKRNDNPQAQRMMAAQQEMQDTLRARSVAWVVGTSLGFEAIVLALAAWIFCRRDY